ncbi:MAG TPA: thiol reductant ABC exporter subunit CydD [Bacteroidales bacterium]|nr:thiol reductant ABC exporter subunit CydD [Bacteroidales bacterium]
MHIHRRLFRLAKDVHDFIFSLVAFSLLMAAVVILQMYLLSVIINNVFFLSEPPKTYSLILLFATIIARALLIWVRERLAQQKAVKIKSDLRLKLFSHLLELGPSYTRSEKTGGLVAVVMDGVEKLDDYFTRYIPSLIHLIVLPPAIILFALYIDWLSGLIMLFTGPLIVFFMWLIGTWAKNLTQKLWQELSSMSSSFLDSLQGLKTLKIFGANRKESENVVNTSDRYRNITMKVLRVAFLSGMVLELAASISIALVAVQVGIRLIEGMMLYQLGLFVLLLTPEFYLPFRALGQHYHSGMEGAAAAERIFEITDSQPSKKVHGSAGSPCKSNISLDFTDVGFTYSVSEQPALQNITCRLEPDTLTAVVGKTGSGKSTFAYLMMGYLQASSGQIMVNGIPLNQLDPEEWKELIAYVPQQPHFFNMSVLENLLLANPDAGHDQVIEAAKNAGAHDFINQLPQGYDTLLTENASRLSGGEKQRLAIARAFLKDAPVLILDEPTSNLDPESEEHIAEATEKLLKNRTTLIIAHRLKTVYRADHILVFDQGKIVESGAHDSLMQQKGIYEAYIKTTGNWEGVML